jgi:CRISPR-associated protein Csd1
MTMLQALDGYYHRLAARNLVTAPGWSAEKFGWCIVIDADGGPVDVYDLHDVSGKKARPMLHSVPAAIKRTVGIAPNFLWDKTAYVLGRTAGEGKRTAQEHAAFVQHHRERLAGQTDEGLVALLRFLERWTPERFDAAPFEARMLDANVLFRLRGDKGFIHQRPAAQALVGTGAAAAAVGEGIVCLVTGEQGALARLHPTIKGVEGAQTAGASLVSFNLDAFTSLGKDQGANAPTSEAAAFRYGTALNHLLTRGGPNRVKRPIGDATVVFWADASDAQVAEDAETLFGAAIDPPEDAEEAEKIGNAMAAIAQGAAWPTCAPNCWKARGSMCWACRPMPRGCLCGSGWPTIFRSLPNIWRSISPTCGSNPRPGLERGAQCQPGAGADHRLAGQVREYPAPACRRSDARGVDRRALSAKPACRRDHPPARR